MVDFWRAWGVYSVFGLEDVADKRRRDFYSSAVPFKIVLQKGLTVDFNEKSQVLACFW